MVVKRQPLPPSGGVPYSCLPTDIKGRPSSGPGGYRSVFACSEGDVEGELTCLISAKRIKMTADLLNHISLLLEKKENILQLLKNSHPSGCITIEAPYHK